jgi:hypothetical protein
MSKTPEIKILSDDCDEPALDLGDELDESDPDAPLFWPAEDGRLPSPEPSSSGFEGIPSSRSALALDLSRRPGSPVGSSFKPSRSDTCIARPETAPPQPGLASPGAMLFHGLAKVGANLDPRRRRSSAHSVEPDQAWLARKQSCRTKIIEV